MRSSTNHLAGSLSPYLLQHARNPVDWYPWGEEALARAKELDRPIFLSIGYSACHWCHVMERESFEDGRVAAALNDSFVPIKVDREERPDLDELYMTAVQAINGRGGWPMSVWLTPSLEPFFGGTYFPPAARYGVPGFLSLLERIASLWETERESLRKDASRLTAQLETISRMSPGSRLPDPSVYARALGHLRAEFDERFGGFGRAPKFPPHMALEFILRRGTEEDRRMAVKTLDAMAAGGMLDHLGGGFARYSVDERWLVPHFEKMLYDNALLAAAYVGGFEATGEPRFAEVARATLDFVLEEMADPAGGFHSALDADSEGEEGRFYVFSKEQIRKILGDGAEEFCEAYGISERGNFEGGRSVVNRLSSWGADLSHLAEAKRKVLDARNTRERPFKDDKVLASWNGLALFAFAQGYRTLGDPRYLHAAARCAEFVEQNLWNGKDLLRVWRLGSAHTPGFLEDYAAVALGLLALFEAGADSKWLSLAEELAGAMRDKFEDPVEGGFFTTERSSPAVLFRLKSAFDGATPSGFAMALDALARVGAATGDSSFNQIAERAMIWAEPSVERAPFAYLGALNAYDLH